MWERKATSVRGKSKRELKEAIGWSKGETSKGRWKVDVKRDRFTSFSFCPNEQRWSREKTVWQWAFGALWQDNVAMNPIIPSRFISWVKSFSDINRKWILSAATLIVRSIHTKDESKRDSAFAFIFGVNWLIQGQEKKLFGIRFPGRLH